MHIADTAVDKHFAADEAGLMGAVYITILKGDSMYGRLYNYVLFSMQPPAKLMPFTRFYAKFFTQAANF